MSLYEQDEGWHGYTRGGNKAHRIYRPSRFPQRLIACTNLPVRFYFRDDTVPDDFDDWCRLCYLPADD